MPAIFAVCGLLTVNGTLDYDFYRNSPPTIDALALLLLRIVYLRKLGVSPATVDFLGFFTGDVNLSCPSNLDCLVFGLAGSFAAAYLFAGWGLVTLPRVPTLLVLVKALFFASPIFEATS